MTETPTPNAALELADCPRDLSSYRGRRFHGSDSGGDYGWQPNTCPPGMPGEHALREHRREVPHDVECLFGEPSRSPQEQS